MGVAPRAVVSAPPATPPLHSLLSTATVVEEPDDVRWEAGFSFLPENCVEAQPWDPCVGPPGDPSRVKSDAEAMLEIVTYQPYVVETQVTCSTFGFQEFDYVGRARRQLDAALSKAMELEFWEGALAATMADAGNGNDPLISCTTTLNPETVPGVPDAVSPSVGLAMLVQALANCGPGSRGMIHATPFLVERWCHGDYLREQSGKLQTCTRGNLVISGSGYTGSPPTGLPPLGPDQAWAFATGPVFLRLGDVEVYPDTIAEALDRDTNDITYRAERTVSAVHDLCCCFAVLIDLCAPLS